LIVSRKWYKIKSELRWKTNRKSYVAYRMVPHTIEDSGVRRVGQPSPLLRKHRLLVYIGNGQPASTRSSAVPTRHGRVIGATKSAHPELGSLPIVVPIDEAVRRTRQCSPCVCMCRERGEHAEVHRVAIVDNQGRPVQFMEQQTVVTMESETQPCHDDDADENCCEKCCCRCCQCCICRCCCRKCTWKVVFLVLGIILLPLLFVVVVLYFVYGADKGDGNNSRRRPAPRNVHNNYGVQFNAWTSRA